MERVEEGIARAIADTSADASVLIGAGPTFIAGADIKTFDNAGIPVFLKDVSQDALERGLSTIRRSYESPVTKGKMTAEELEQRLALITPAASYDGFDRADIVVEAVFEDMDLKKATFAELGRVTRPDAILASNSATLDIDELGRASGRPSQVIVNEYRARFGDYWRPAPLLERLVAEGRGFSGGF